MNTTGQSDNDALREAARLIKDGQKAEAKQILAAILKSNPKNARAWYLASFLSEDEPKKIQALERALAIDPQYQEARRALQKLRPDQDLIDDLLATPVTTTTAPKASARNDANQNLLIILVAFGLLAVLLIIGLIVVAPRAGLFRAATATRTPTLIPSRTPTNTFTPTLTPVPTDTPLPPTPLPGPVTLTSLTGEAKADLYSAPHEYIGGGKGNFILKGLSTVFFKNNLLSVSIIPTDNSAGGWQFEFSAPDMQTGHMYNKATRYPFNDKDAPGISVNSPGKGCNEILGQFTVVQQTPQLVISFTQFCEKNEQQLLFGTITFTPVDMLTPTPTIPPEKLLQFPFGPGEVQADLISSPDDFIGGGKGSFTVRGSGSATFRDNTLTIGITPDDPAQDGFGFQFYAPLWVVGQDYQKATRLSFSDKRYPGIEVGSGSRGCNKILGNFKVLQQSPNLVMSFTQHCEAGTSSLSGTITFKPLDSLTPTPTIPPEKVFAPSPSLGQAKVELNSAPKDPVGHGRGTFTLDGQSDVQIKNGIVTFNVTSADTSDDSWQFNFYAPPVIEVGRNYDVKSAHYAISSKVPFAKVGLNGSQNDFACSVVSGQFEVEQQTPNIVISFTQFCGGDPNTTIKGKLTFTPASALTATPTIPPEKVFAPTATYGEISADLNSSGNDPLGAGQGKFTFKGPAQLLIDNGAYQFSVTNADDPSETWQFTFYSPSPTIGLLNDHASRWPNNKIYPALSVIHQGNKPGMVANCLSLSGSFTFEQQTPTIVVSFTHLCEKDPSRSLSGKFTFTPLSNLTATPTIAPEKLFKPVNTTGKLHLEFDSLPQDKLGAGRGHVSIDGQGSVKTEKGVLSIQMIGPEEWYFTFYAPGLQVGYNYQNVKYIPSQTNFPSMTINTSGTNCPSLNGQFEIEQTSQIVISFDHICNDSADSEFKGKLTFTPLAMLTPTPTPAPDKIYKPSLGKGSAVAVLTSSTGDYIGGGVGNFMLKGEAQLVSNYGNDNAFTINLLPADQPFEPWLFEFYAPVYVVGQTYQHATHYPSNNKQLPGLNIEAPGRACNTLVGDFTIVKKSPALVISFTQSCDSNPSSVLKGTITFTSTAGG